MNEGFSDDASVRSGPSRRPLGELARLFLKLGTVAFGGPAAHIAMMEDEVVRRRGWLTREAFLDMLGATNLIPGPNSTEMAIHIGYRRAGWAGLVVAGTCFIGPAVLIVTMIAWAYVRFGTLPAVGGLLYGVKPVVLAVVVQALWRLGKTAVRGWPSAILFGVALAASLLGVNELVVLFAGALVMIVASPRPMKALPSAPVAALPAVVTFATAAPAIATTAAATTVAGVTLGPLFFVFLKVGSVLFGSGYVLLAFLRSDLVTRTHWLTETQLLDAVAVGQVTPGPVFTTATFIGYLLAGPAGAAVATLGIFLPAFFFVAVSAPFVPRLRQSAVAGRFLDGLNVTSLALMAAVTLQLAGSAVVDSVTAALAVGAAVALVRFDTNSTLLIAVGAIVGVTRVVVGWT